MARGISPTRFLFASRHWSIPVIASFAMIVCAPLWARTIHVDPRSGDDTGNGDKASPRETISAALALAVSGDRIVVAPGSSDEDVTVTRDRITLSAARPDQLKLTGRLTLKCNDTVVDGLSWSGQNGGAVVNIYGKRNILRRCRFREFGRKFACKGIWIRQTGDHRDNQIQHCLFEDWTGHGSSSCIKVSQNGREMAFRGTVIRNNVFRRGNRPGNNTAIQLYCPTLVEHNIIYDCIDGIEGKGSGNTIRNNVVFRCSGAEAMSNRSGSNNRFENNLLFENTLAWEIYSGSNNTWRNNTVLNCGMIARIKRGGPGGFREMLVENNLFSANRRGFSWEEVTCPASHIHFRKNTFIGGGRIEAEGRKHFSETGRVEQITWSKNRTVKSVFALLYSLAAVAGPSGGHVDLDDALSGPATRQVRSGGRPPTADQLHRPVAGYRPRSDNVRVQVDFEREPYRNDESLVGLLDPSTRTRWTGIKERPNYMIRKGRHGLSGKTTSGGRHARILDSSPGGTRGASLPLSEIRHDRPYYLSFWLACDFPEAIDSTSFGVAPLFSVSCSAWEQGGHRMVGMSVSGKDNLDLFGPLKQWLFLEFEIDPTARRFRFKIDGVAQHRGRGKKRTDWFAFAGAGKDAKSRTATSLWFSGGKRFVGTLAVDDITIGGWTSTGSR
ncbi:MAG: right-handed parallel beta-helix repeat-containing protein [Planctomycetaceae bacterium]